MNVQYKCHTQANDGWSGKINMQPILPSRSLRTHPGSLQGCLSSLHPQASLCHQSTKSVLAWNRKRRKALTIGIHKMLSEHLTTSERRGLGVEERGTFEGQLLGFRSPQVTTSEPYTEKEDLLLFCTDHT